MVFVTSLIGVKRLREDVLKAHLHANVGPRILVSFAILFWVMILDRIVQGVKQ